MHFGIFYTRLAHHTNYELSNSFFAYVMLGTGITTQTSQVQLHTHASLFEHSEQMQVSKYQTLHHHLHLFPFQN